VTRRYDRTSGFRAGASGVGTFPAPLPGRIAESPADGPPTGDVLSDVLRTVRLTGALFFLVDASSPWTIEMPETEKFAASILPRAQHVVSYHIVVRGSCWGCLAKGAAMRLQAGDVLVLPHGDAYVMAMDRSMRGAPAAAEVLAFMREMAAGRHPFTVQEGGGGPARLRLVCGFLGCDVRPFNPLLSALPRQLPVRQAFGSTGDPLGKLIEFALAESRERRAGGECIRLRLSELMFVEVVRRHLATLPPAQGGWLAGLRDDLVGRALARLPERPADPWTLEKLAKDVGTSRSVLAERFTDFVGRPPMQYLMLWRMQMAARLLADGEAKVWAAATEVGYDSEAAFSRTFKRVTGVPPATWREQHTARVSAPA
jgi:AraC-like DNA-binding protein